MRVSILEPKIPKKIKIQKSSWNTKKSSLPFCAAPPLLPKKRTTNNELKQTNIHSLSCSSFNSSIVLAISINKNAASAWVWLSRPHCVKEQPVWPFINTGSFFVLINLSVHFAAGNSRQQRYLKFFVRCEVRFYFVTFLFVFFFQCQTRSFAIKCVRSFLLSFFYKIQKKDSLS